MTANQSQLKAEIASVLSDRFIAKFDERSYILEDVESTEIGLNVRQEHWHFNAISAAIGKDYFFKAFSKQISIGTGKY